MSDKLSPAMSVEIVFTDSEAPPARKLNAISSQLRRISTVFERAIGDIHSQSWPYSSSSDSTLSTAWGRRTSSGNAMGSTGYRFLDIANLARLIGPSSNLNPRFLGGEKTLVEDIPVGVHEFLLAHPILTRNSSNPVLTDPELSNWVSAPNQIVAAGDYHVDEGGRVFSYTATTGGTITYDVNPNKWGGGKSYSSSKFNVIPDPNQLTAGGAGCTVGALTPQSRYPVTLPLCTHQQSNLGITAVLLTDSDINYNQQLTLPFALTNNFVSGDAIPEGFLYLKNYTTNEMYEDASYYYDTESSIEVGAIDLTEAIAAGDKFCIVTVGSDITTAIDDLRNKMYHSHDRTFGEPFVKVEGIAGQVAEPGESGPFTSSDRPGNYFPQYLHRDGYSNTYDDNINARNAMRGDIMFALSPATVGAYLGSTGETYGLKFGGLSNVAQIYRNADDDLQYVSGAAGRTHKFTGGSVQAMAGVVGDEVGLVAPAPYASYATFTPIGTWADAAVDSPHPFTLAAGIEAKSWYSVSVAFNPTGDKWIPPHQDLLVGEWAYQVYWEETAGTSTLYVVFLDAAWAALSGAVPVPYRIFIQYES